MSRAFSMKWACLALAVVFVLFASLTIATSTAYADDYKYKVRVWGGNQGTVSGPIQGDGYAEIEVAKDTPLTLSSTFGVTVTNDKYYRLGFRPGGADNQERLKETDNHSNGKSNLKDAIVVNEDMDFVVAYGVEGNMVPYTLHFVERGTGRVLADPITRYGAQGDKPVAAYEYVAGYRPLYRNITGTLKASGNDWTFEYVSLTQPAASSSTTAGGTTQGGTTQGGGTTSTTTTGGGTTGGGAASTTTTGGTTGGDNAGGTAQGPAATEPPATEEILDQDVPLADLPSSSSSSDSSSTATQPADQQPGLPIAAIIGIAVALIAAIGLVFVLLKRRQEREMMQ